MPTVGGAVLVGGQSRRFGSDKALADVAGQPMASVVVEAMRSAGVDPVVAIGGTPASASQLGLITVEDMFPGEGPLGGTATALSYFTTSHVLVAACDLPLLTVSVVTDLLSNVVSGKATVCSVDGKPQLALACWPTSSYRRLLSAIRSGERRWQSLLGLVDYILVEVNSRFLEDADDPAKLVELLKER